MASKTTTFEVTHACPTANLFPCGAPLPGTDSPEAACALAAGMFDAIASGALPASVTIQLGGAAEAQASGTVTLSSAAGDVTATINGVALTVTTAVSDTNTAALLAAAINASSNALVTGIVTASSSLGVVTITSVDATKTANAITLAASGTGATANVARLTGGAGHDVGGVTFSAL